MGVADAPASSREHLRRRNQKPAPLSASAQKEACLHGRIYVRGTGKAQYSKIGYVDNHAKEARNAVAGNKRRAWTNPAFDKEAQLLQEDSVRMPPGF